MGYVTGPRALSALSHWVTLRQIKSVVLADNCCEELLEWCLKEINKVQIIDINKDTKEMDLDQLFSITRNNDEGKSLLVLYVSPYGKNPSISKLKEIKSAGDFSFLEDRCLSRPILPHESSEIDEISDAQLYSTGYSKYCDLLFGGWISDTKLDKNISLDIDSDLYFKTIYNRRLIIDNHKEKLNSILDGLTVGIKINTWSSKIWRYTIEVKDPKLYLSLINKNGGFASRHYSDRRFSKHMNLINTDNHKNHVINIFNDLRADKNYIDIIEKSTAEYIHALHNTS